MGGMDIFLESLLAFFRGVHLAAMRQGQLAVMIALYEQERTCMEIVTATGYDRSTVRQNLQSLKQLQEVEMRPWRSAGHGQVEYVYSLTDRGKNLMGKWMEAFSPVMSNIVQEEKPEDGPKEEDKSLSGSDLLGNVK